MSSFNDDLTLRTKVMGQGHSHLFNRVAACYSAVARDDFKLNALSSVLYFIIAKAVSLAVVQCHSHLAKKRIQGK